MLSAVGVREANANAVEVSLLSDVTSEATPLEHRASQL